MNYNTFIQLIYKREFYSACSFQLKITPFVEKAYIVCKATNYN